MIILVSDLFDFLFGVERKLSMRRLEFFISLPKNCLEREKRKKENNTYILILLHTTERTQRDPRRDFLAL